MATQTIDATLFASSHPDIVKRTSVSGLIFSVAMLLVGVFIFASIFEMSDKSSTLSMADGAGYGIRLAWRVPSVLEIEGSGLFADGQCDQGTQCFLRFEIFGQTYRYD